MLLLVAATSLFTVTRRTGDPHRIRRILGTNYAPGLHCKWPWDQVVTFDARILSESYTGETFLTNDNRGLIVDFYIMWRVKDAGYYFQATGGNEDIAGRRLAEIVKDGIKSVVAERTLEEIVLSDRAAVTDEMFVQAKKNVAGLGVDLVDVRVQAINLPDEVSARVYESMKQNLSKIASGLRAEGQSQSVPIQASAQRQRTEILADAGAGGAARPRRGRCGSDRHLCEAPIRRIPSSTPFFRSLQAYDHAPRQGRRSAGRDAGRGVLQVPKDSDSRIRAVNRAACGTPDQEPSCL